MLDVDINKVVKKGDQLGQLDQQEILAQVAAQKAQLQAAEANVATFEANIEQDKVNAAAPDLPMWKNTLDRNEQMAKEGVVSQQALDNANKDYLAALNKRDGARAQICVDTAKLKQAKAQVAQSQASLGAARRTAQLHHRSPLRWTALSSPATSKSAMPSVPSSFWAPLQHWS